uniref:Uncharacterized protein n=1 Tax=Globodera rostochiensis TaxID=31243 RepID=A0A914HZ56_GLORO
MKLQHFICFFIVFLLLKCCENIRIGKLETVNPLSKLSGANQRKLADKPTKQENAEGSISQSKKDSEAEEAKNPKKSPKSQFKMHTMQFVDAVIGN